MSNSSLMALLCFIMIFNNASHSKNKERQDDMYFTTAITDNVKMSSVLATRIRVEMMSESEMMWVGFELDTMIKSHCKTELLYADSLDSDIIHRFKQSGISYCAIPFVVSTVIDTLPEHMEVRPSVGTVGIERVLDKEEFDSAIVYVIVVDVNLNRIIKQERSILRTETCDDDFVICARDAINDMTSGTKMSENFRPVSTDMREKALSYYAAGEGLFIFGSILTLAEAGIVVSGNSESAKTAGMALFITGHTGLITTGLSTIPLNKSVKLMYGQSIPGAGKGWVLYGASLGMMITGLFLTGNGANSDNLPMIITGICSICAGEGLTIPAWFSFRNIKKKASKMVDRVSSK